LEINEKASQDLFEIAAAAAVSKIVFSSTAAVYGKISQGVAKESHPTDPISPYGQSKLNAERKLEEIKNRFGLETISLRYFNVSGSSNKNFAETNSESLIPKSLATVIAGGRPLIYGDDYETLDGTCIRDFIHVRDLADAHFLAGHEQISLPSCLNLGSGIGFSVKQVLDSISRVTEIDFEPLILGRRDGDMEKLIAETELARELLNFSPSNNLDDMVRSIF
jgi:UDP-glucose 4-epimerase